MGLHQKAAAGGADFAPAPEGTHRAVCTRVVDMGTQDGNYGPKRKIQLGFEIDAAREDGSPFMAFSHLTLSTHPKSNLRHLLESWRGRAYEEGEEVNLVALLKRSCLLTLVRNGDYTNISAITPMIKGMEPLQPAGDTVLFDADEPDLGELDKIGERMREKIEASPEYRKAMGKPVPAGAMYAATSELDAAAATESNGPGAGDFDDDIPF